MSVAIEGKKITLNRSFGVYVTYYNSFSIGTEKPPQ
jgi:hypothetical protein